MNAQVGRTAVLVATILVFSAPLDAIIQTTRITIEGGDLLRPIQIADSAITTQFGVWSGQGTSSTPGRTGEPSDGFMIEWRQGPITGRPTGLPRYKVDFYSMSPDRGNATRPRGIEFLSYSVYYELDEATGRGFVYLPGKTDPEWENNVFSIMRRVEGNWFRPTAAWEQIVHPLLLAGTTR